MIQLHRPHQPELTILGDLDPQWSTNPAADFLKLARDERGNQILQSTLEKEGMPRAAEDAFRNQVDAPDESQRAAATIGKLLIATKAGSRLDPDEETWSAIEQDTIFNKAKASFKGLTERNPGFEDLRYEMAGRILAVFCLRTEEYFGWSEQEHPPLKNTA